MKVLLLQCYYKDHNPPHFHVEYNGMEAIYDISEGAFIKGAVPSRQARLVLAWAEIHKNELIEIWNTNEYRKIEPLV